ncbi:MAG: tetratricopeptide repeat protein [Planctomycetota bacterium]
MSSANESEISQQLRELQDRAGELISQCRFAGSSRLYGELRRRGRAEHRAEAYLIGTFFQMDQAQYLLDFQTMRERAVELIAMLENEEQVRQIQPDLPKEQYEFFVYSMTSCAYENLAEATGQLDGYNSEGMHGCISDGIQICRRTGKTSCVSCFREYACDVYMSADDPDIAGHQCRLVVDQSSGWSDRGDRRWLASLKLGWLHLLQGRTDDALAAVEHALILTGGEHVSLKLESRIRALTMRDTVRLALGQSPIMQDDESFSEMPTMEECPVFHLNMDLNTALKAVIDQRPDEAVAILTRWDQRLQQCHGTHLWFEVRLRLIAAKLILGDRRQADALGRQLEQKARTSNDYLTLRRLQQLQDSGQPSPFAAAFVPRRTAPEVTLQSADSVSAAAAGGAQKNADVTQDELEQAISEAVAELPPLSPLAETIGGFRERMNELMQDWTEERFESLRADVLAIDSSQTQHFEDAAGVLHLAAYLVGTAEDGDKVWKWANSIAARHRDQGVIISLLGTLGDSLRNSGNEEMAEKITAERTEQLFRKSLELEPERSRNFQRAGDHFAAQDNQGEAERCYARAFRLNRTDGTIVRRLADLYNTTDRPRDALHVLDLSLREGCEDGQVAFDAAMLAFRLKQYDSTLTYLERYETQAESSLWTNYYRGVCYYEQGDYAKALEAIDHEEILAESSGWHLEVMRAAIQGRQGNAKGAQVHINTVMDTSLSQVDYLSPNGLTELLQRLQLVAVEALHDLALADQIDLRLLRSGLMPDPWFQHHRDDPNARPVENVRLFRCLVLQPVDSEWEADSDRLFDQAGWTSYLAEWGVLADSEESARELVLQWQARCYHLPAEVQEVVEGEESYTDIPGIVWQGGRYGVDDNEDSADVDALDDDFDDED